MIKDPKYADYLRRRYGLDTLDEREQESPKDLNVKKASIETETKPTEISIVPTETDYCSFEKRKEETK
jgi:hypothetical protein